MQLLWKTTSDCEISAIKSIEREEFSTPVVYVILLLFLNNSGLLVFLFIVIRCRIIFGIRTMGKIELIEGT